ncbi:hypothetical protein ABPG73_012584 [Tetrahymena malaccensis]
MNQLTSTDTVQSTVNASSELEQQKKAAYNVVDKVQKNFNQDDFEKKLQQYKSQYKNQKSLINNGATSQKNNIDESQKVPSNQNINNELKDQQNQNQINDLASSETNKVDEQGLKQKQQNVDSDNRLNQIQENKAHQQIDLDTQPQSTNINNFFNISQEIQIQDLQEKRQPQLVGINISPNSKITINRELSNSYFGDHDQDDRSMYHEQEKLYSPTLDKQKTTQSKNESELNRTSSPKQNKKVNDSDCKQVSEFEASSPKIIKNEIIGDTDTDKKISNAIHTPTSSATKETDNNTFQGRDNFKKLSLKMNQVPLDEQFISQQQQVQPQQNNKNDQSSQVKQLQKRKKSEEQKVQQNKDNQNKKQQQQNELEEGQSKEYEEDYDEEEEEEEDDDDDDDDDDDEEGQEEENIKNNKGIIKNEETNQQCVQNNIQNGNQKTQFNMNDQDEKNQMIENGNLNYLSSEQYYEDLYRINQKKVEEKPNYEQEIRVMQHDKQIYLRVSNIQEGIVTLISDDYSSVKMPLIFLPNDISCGSIVKLSIDREYDPEEEMKQSVVDIQQQILSDPNYFL